MERSDSGRIRYGVVGLGNIAQVAVLPAFEHASDNSELAALISSDEEKLDGIGEQYGVAHRGGYDDLERLIVEAELDAVYLATPNSNHRELAERAARAGAHVLCEKPLAPTVEDCRAIVRVADECGVKLMVAYRLHFESANLQTVEAIRRGDIGTPRIFSSVFCHQVNPGIRTSAAAAGGALYDLGIYCINAARYLFRDEPTEVYGQQLIGTEERFREVDEVTSGLLRFPRDRVAQFTVSQGAANVSELRIIGTKGDIRLDPAYDYTRELCTYTTVGGEVQTAAYLRSDQFAPELIHFSDCILRDVEPEPSGREGLADAMIMEALVLSSQRGTTIRIEPEAAVRRPDGSQAMRKPPVAEVETIHAPSPSR